VTPAEMDALEQRMFEAGKVIIGAAIAEAIVAERRRIAAIAREMGATYPVTLEPPPGSERATTRAAFPFADFIEDTMLDDGGGEDQP
jgi:hypothetical protein